MKICRICPHQADLPPEHPDWLSDGRAPRNINGYPPLPLYLLLGGRRQTAMPLYLSITGVAPDLDLPGPPNTILD